MLHASAEQIGEAARMREACHGRDRMTLNYIVHSPSPGPQQRYGRNPFADRPTYDPSATAALRAIALRHRMPLAGIEFAEMVHSLREFIRSTRRPGERRRAQVAEQVVGILERWWRLLPCD